MNTSNSCDGHEAVNDELQTYDLSPLQDHCYNLSQLAASLYWEPAADWLHAASGIVRVKFDTIRHNQSFGWCAGADEYDLKRDAVLSEFATELIRFNLIWGSLEWLIDNIVPKQNTKPTGKINDVCRHLKLNYEPTTHLLFYQDQVAELRSILKQIEYYESLRDEFALKPHVGVSGIGIYVVYKIRNMFAHGSLTFPHPDEEDEVSVQALDTRMVMVSSRIVLLTIQMLFCSHYKTDTFEVDSWWESDEGDREIDINVYLRTLHTSPLRKTNNQILLPLSGTGN